jgi:hypothetical protein
MAIFTDRPTSTLWAVPVVYKYFEFRGAVDRTAVVYCKLCGRIIFEIHEDSIEDGLAIAQEHLLKFHALSLKAT